MHKGTYRRRLPDFSGYLAKSVKLRLFTREDRKVAGCGATALALLTGVPPEHIAAANGRRSHYSDRFVTDFLAKHGFSALRLTMCDVSSCASCIQGGHVLLVSQLISRNEGTWVVILSGLACHNFAFYPLGGLSFLNKPLLSAYLLFHPRWAQESR